MTRPPPAYSGPICECCPNGTTNGVPRPKVPARYRWTGLNGHVTLVCVRCCALWRRFARGDPRLQAQRIEELP